ncbi:DMT family transporter [Alcaligenaceae bacterium LF4-65]|jgi:drug/metabolite transporter (DMT)-like permease|uniref:DMT family transporter n=1 Tax=Zwartia hollandica TaxID=324606 RepID=A0A953NDE6_9BURK|nr:DMT family transporter [Zwartia hollandica]MBZ1351599.1 DMT family transporter [Zwartia hollandica]
MRATTLLVLTVPPLMWASNAIVGRMAAGAIPPLTLNFLRWVVALLVLLPFILTQLKVDWSTGRQHWKLFAATGFLSTTCYNALQYLALITSSPINIALITAAGPIFTLLVGRAFFSAHIGRSAALGAVLSILGVAWVLVRGEIQNLTQVAFVSGDLFMLFAIALWSIYTWLLRERPKSMSGYSVLALQMLWGLVFAVPMVLAEVLWGGYAPIQWDGHTLGMVVYVALGPALLAYICWQRAVALTGSQLPMFFLNLTPVFAAILAVLLLGEFPQIYHLIGLALIVLGIVLSNRSEATVSAKK